MRRSKEAGRAAANFKAGAPIRLFASPVVALMFLHREEDLDSEEFLAERPPQFVDQEVGTWGNTWPASLVARTIACERARHPAQACHSGSHCPETGSRS